jgi:DNA primase
MYQAGIQNVVSSSGTSLTKDQIKLIRRYTQNITILYDGDPAGIKASFRGIDLILEEGMNVKVVLFPEGEDPDSYSKKASTSELEAYIQEHTQDFISFKADILLKGGEKDPIKKAELIREIVHSVALIPDQITRTVYLQQIASQFDIQESIISNELMKLRKNVLSKQLQTPELNQLHVPTQVEEVQTIEPTLENNAENSEHDLIRILIKFGTRVIEVEQLDAQGEATTAETSVTEFICHELDKDELAFEHPKFAKIHQLIVEGLAENQLLSSTYFRQLEDQTIVQFVSEIESQEYELSTKWLSQYNITTRSESDRLQEAVFHSIYNFKSSKIEAHIRSIQVRLKEAESMSDEELLDALSEQMTYEKIKIAFAEKLGRIILR